MDLSSFLLQCSRTQISSFVCRDAYKATGGVLPVCVDPETFKAYFLFGLEKIKKSEVNSATEYFCTVDGVRKVRDVICHFHGFIDVGETLEVGAARECFEESRGVFGSRREIWTCLSLPEFHRDFGGTFKMCAISLGMMTAADRNALEQKFLCMPCTSVPMAEMLGLRFVSLESLFNACREYKIGHHFGDHIGDESFPVNGFGQKEWLREFLQARLIEDDFPWGAGWMQDLLHRRGLGQMKSIRELPQLTEDVLPFLEEYTGGRTDAEPTTQHPDIFACNSCACLFYRHKPSHITCKSCFESSNAYRRAGHDAEYASRQVTGVMIVLRNWGNLLLFQDSRFRSTDATGATQYSWTFPEGYLPSTQSMQGTRPQPISRTALLHQTASRVLFEMTRGSVLLAPSVFEECETVGACTDISTYHGWRRVYYINVVARDFRTSTFIAGKSSTGLDNDTGMALCRVVETDILPGRSRTMRQVNGRQETVGHLQLHDDAAACVRSNVAKRVVRATLSAPRYFDAHVVHVAGTSADGIQNSMAISCLDGLYGGSGSSSVGGGGRSSGGGLGGIGVKFWEGYFHSVTPAPVSPCALPLLPPASLPSHPPHLSDSSHPPHLSHSTPGLLDQHNPSTSNHEKIIYFIRHGESEANAVEHGGLQAKSVKNDVGFVDTVLSARGIAQARQAATFVGQANVGFDVDVVLVSPLRRALQTASLGLHALGVPFVVEATLRECTYWNEFQSRGAPGSNIREFVGALECAPLVDMGSVARLDNREDQFWQPEEEAHSLTHTELTQRQNMCVSQCLGAIMKRPESRIAVVAHWGVLWSVLGSGIDAPNCGIYKVFVRQEEGSHAPAIHSIEFLWAPTC